jgi:hypothetical protein
MIFDNVAASLSRSCGHEKINHQFDNVAARAGVVEIEMEKIKYHHEHQ